MNKAVKERVLGLLGAVVKANLIAFGLFLLSSIILRAAADSFGRNDKLIFLIIGIFYLYVFYATYIKQRDELYLPKGEPFSYQAEAAAYFRTEGKYLAIILGILALICEIEMLVQVAARGEDARFLLTTICLFLFPLADLVPIPVVRMLVCFLYANGAVLLLQLLRSKKVWKQFDKREAAGK